MKQKREQAAKPEPSNESLLTRCANGDDGAWAHLVDRYKRLVYSAILGFGLSPEDTADAFQDVWIELHQSVHRIRQPEALATWLLVCARRRAYKLATKQRARTMCGLSETLIDPGQAPSDAIEREDRRQRIERALVRIGGIQAELLRQLFLTEPRPSYQEIAKRSSIAQGSIGPLRARAIARLRRILEKEA